MKPKSTHESALTKKHVPAKGYKAPQDDTREGEEMTSKGPLVSSADTGTSNGPHITPSSVDAIFEVCTYIRTCVV